MKLMNRRQLFAVLSGAALVAGELWIPSAKTIFLPPRIGWRRAPLGYVGEFRAWVFYNGTWDLIDPAETLAYGYGEPLIDTLEAKLVSKGQCERIAEAIK